MPFKFLSAASLAALSYAELINNECWTSKGAVGNTNTNFDAVVKYDTDKFDTSEDTIMRLLWGDRPQMWVKTCKTTATNYSFRSITVGAEENAEEDATEPNMENTTWGYTYGATATGEVCTYTKSDFTQLTMKWRATNLSKTYKGGIYNMSFTSEVSPGIPTTFDAGIYTKAGTEET